MTEFQLPNQNKSLFKLKLDMRSPGEVHKLLYA
jgi:hypothetical protein